MIKCQFEDGNNASLRHVTFGAVAVKEGKILLIKRAAHLLEGGKWALPGGYMDRDETMAEGMLRELLEETGYTGRVTKLLQIIDNPDRPHEDRQNLAVAFVVEVHELVGQPDHEVADVQWFDLQQLPASDQIAFDHEAMIQVYIQSEVHHQHVDLLPSLSANEVNT